MKFYALLYHFYSTSIARGMRFLIGIFLLFYFIKISGEYGSITSFVESPGGNSTYLYQTSNLLFGLLSIFLMGELFFRFKISRMQPAITLDKNDGKTIDSSLTLKAHEVFLSSNTQIIIKSLISKKKIRFLLEKAEILEKEIQFLDVSKEELLKQSYIIAKKLNGKYITTLDIFAAYLLFSEKQTKIFLTKELKEEEFLDIVHWARVKYPNEEFPSPFILQLWGRGFADDWVYGWTLETQKVTSNFTDFSLSNNQVLVGRTKEKETLISALSKNESANVLLVGNSGVGKTTLISHFARESFLGNVPSHFSGKRVLELSVGSLLAGSENQGALEERIKNVIQEIEHSGDVILYIPNFETIAGGGGFSFDATGVLWPALSGNKIHVIGTTTPAAYKQFLEKRSEFSEVFEKIPIEEPAEQDAIRMLEEASIILEAKHTVSYSYKAVKTAVLLSSKYMSDSYLPGKAIQLLDNLASTLAAQKKYRIETEDVISYIEEKTHVRVGKPKKDEQELLLHLEEALHSRIIDQEEAVKTVAASLRRVRSGITNPNRPIGTFLFLGPTGVGKTELAKALASVYFGNEKAMVRVDMGAYKDALSINRLIGAPPGADETEGELTQAIKKQPFSLLLLDEFEKAHRDVLDVFLPVFDEGKLTDARGKTYSFTNSIIIATSNAGSEIIREKIKEGMNMQELKPLLLDELQKTGVFKPELLNRFDAVVIFEPLGPEEVKEVVKLLTQEVVIKLKEQDIIVLFNDEALSLIAKNGFDPQFGARPLRRFIQDAVENVLAEKILKEEITKGSSVSISANAANQLVITSR